MPNQRITTLFGVHIPPLRKVTFSRDNNLCMVFVIKSKRIISKKNTNSIWCKREKAKKYLDDLYKANPNPSKGEVMKAIKLVYGRFVGSKGYGEFLEQQRPFLDEQRSHYVNKYQDRGVIFPLTNCKIKINFFFTGNYKQDLPNKEQTIADMLVDCHILQDDAFQIAPEITTQGALYTDEITENICLIYLSIDLPKKQINAKD